MALLIAASVLAGGVAWAAPAPAPGTTAAGRGPATRPHVAANTIVIFPIENNSMIGGKQLGEALVAHVKSGISHAGTYSIASYYPASPLLQRARQEQSLTREEAEGVVDPARGTVDPTRAANVAMRMGARYALLGSIEQVDVDRAANRANVTVTMQLLDTATGAPAKTAGVTGTYTGTAAASQDDLAMAAGKDAVKRALVELGLASESSDLTPPALSGGTNDASAVVPAKKKKNLWIPIGALLAILIIGIG
jgi:hypothetical protein